MMRRPFPVVKFFVLCMMCGLFLVSMGSACLAQLTLDLTKQSTLSEAANGENLTFSIQLQVSGAASTTVSFTDTLPGGLNYLSYSSEPPGWSCIIWTGTVDLGSSGIWSCSGTAQNGVLYEFNATAQVATTQTALITNVVGASTSGASDSANATVLLNPVQEPVIPTLDEWGMLLLTLILAGTSVAILRKRKTLGS